MLCLPITSIERKIEKPTKKSPPLSLEMQIFSKTTKKRGDVERFIKQGFYKSYAAEISITMPYLLAVNNGKFRAALGIRSAKQPLFIEQYLELPIEQTPLLRDEKISRNEIVEIGHLYSNAQRFTIPLFLVSAISLFYCGFKYMAFSGTDRVLSIISRIGLECHYLVDATQGALNHSSDDNWGSYYSTSPKVVLLSLAQVIKVIDGGPIYQNLFDQLDTKIAEVCLSLKGIK
jgi:hypothetical protein